ncbi:radical SAM domain-containing protein, partial [groundwater metagenome]
MFDPVELAELTRNIVCKNNQRKYYRFRSSRFYGGISTADCVGCCLRCVFCWSWKMATRPQECGHFYSPEEVARKLIAIAKRKKLRQLRISGNEPTICREHLIRVLELIPSELLSLLRNQMMPFLFPFHYLLNQNPAYYARYEPEGRR